MRARRSRSADGGNADDGGKAAESVVREQVAEFLSRLEQEGWDRTKLTRAMHMGDKKYRRTLNGTRTVHLYEWEGLLKLLDCGSSILPVLSNDGPEPKESDDAAKPRIVAPPLDLTFRKAVRGHWRTRIRVGTRAVQPDKWRAVRDWLLMTACCSVVLKYANYALGIQFGLRFDLSDPLLLGSIAIILMFGYAFAEDLFRRRYFLGRWEVDPKDRFRKE